MLYCLSTFVLCSLTLRNSRVWNYAKEQVKICIVLPLRSSRVWNYAKVQVKIFTSQDGKQETKACGKDVTLELRGRYAVLVCLPVHMCRLCTLTSD